MIASTRDEDVLRHRCKNSTANECDIPAHPSALPCVPLPVINASLTAFRIRAPPSDSPPQMNSSVREIRWKFLPESPGPSFLFMLPSIQLSGPAMEKNKKKKKKRERRIGGKFSPEMIKKKRKRKKKQQQKRDIKIEERNAPMSVDMSSVFLGVPLSGHSTIYGFIIIIKTNLSSLLPFSLFFFFFFLFFFLFFFCCCCCCCR